MKKKIWLLPLILLLVASLVACATPAPAPTPAPSPAPAPVKKEMITFADLDFDSIRVNNNIAGFILEHGYGFKFQETHTSPPVGFTGLVRGDIDIVMEAWNTHLPLYEENLASGEVVDLGSNYVDVWQGWLVPRYVIEGDAARGIEPVAPDLKSVFDLPQYWELFKDPEEKTKGRFYNGAAGWQDTEISSQKLKSYGLDEYYTDFITGSAAALSGSLISAYEKGEPWFGYHWAPTWTLGKVDFIQIEEPPYDEKIWEESKACAWQQNPTRIVVNGDFHASNPEVVEFLSKYETTAKLQSEMLAYMQDTEADWLATTIWFLERNESVWTGWVPADVAEKIKAALQ